jgi:predicted nucleic acid-binding protein
LTIVVDASVVTAALIDADVSGQWARQLLTGEPAAAPHLLPAETANALRGAALAGRVSPHLACIALRDLMQMRFALYDYQPFAERAWELQGNVTVYDAWYVALAEALDAHLATLDRRLARTPGARCSFLLPPE